MCVCVVTSQAWETAGIIIKTEHIWIEWWIVKTSHTRLIVYVRAGGHANKLSSTPKNHPGYGCLHFMLSPTTHTIKHMFLIHFVSFDTLCHHSYRLYLLFKSKRENSTCILLWFLSVVCLSIFITCSTVEKFIFYSKDFASLGFFNILSLHSVMRHRGIRERKTEREKEFERHIIGINCLENFLWIFFFHSKHLYKC